MTGHAAILTDDAEAMNGTIARRIAALRKGKELTFDELAARSGVSKGMLVHIEQGRANPSIAILCKLAASLRVSVAHLVAIDDDGAGRVRIVSDEKAPVLWRGPRGGVARLLIGSDGLGMFELWEWCLEPGERYEAHRHGAGTVELIHVREGVLSLEIAGAPHLVRAGSSALARTDCAHGYACYGRKKTRLTMAVTDPHEGE
jgi:transcriptional regulator with XRE-family HTH domain